MNFKNFYLAGLVIFLFLLTTSLTAQDTTQLTQTSTEAIQKTDGFFEWGNFSLGAILGGVLGGILSFILTSIFFKGNIDNKVESKKLEVEETFKTKAKDLEQQFSQIVNAKKESIEKWVRDHNKEDQLIKHCRIAICGESDTSIAEGLLAKIGFQADNIVTDLNLPYEILFINNLEGSLDKEILLQYVKTMNPNALAFHYTNNRRAHYPTDELMPKTLQTRVNFANSSAQLFGNLLNSIKFRERLKEYGDIG
ncbi:MAG: NARF domain-containing protein [Bacteroidota bacterium]